MNTNRMLRIVLSLIPTLFLVACENAPTEEESTSSSVDVSSSSLPVSSSSLTSSSLDASSSSLASSSTEAISSSVVTPVPGTPLVYAEQTYKTVVIGTQTWMAENLNFTPTTGNSWCYANLPANCALYGRLYDYATALTVCPSGWHLPDTTAWNVMEEKVGGTGIAGARLKSKTGWNSSASSTDDFGFSALPSGMYTGSDFDYVGIVSNWWTASVSGTTTAWYRSISNDVADTDMNHSDFSQTIGFSVRCILD